MASPLKLSNQTPEIVEAYKNNMSLRDIANLHGVSTGTVRNLLVREGVALRQRGRKSKAQD